MNALYLYLYITVSLPLRYCISLTLIFALYQSAYFSLCLSLLLQFYTICCLLSSLQSGTLLNYINQSNGVLRLFAALAEGCEIFKNEGASVGKSSSLLSFDLYVMTSNVGANDVRCLTEERTITFVLYSLHSSRYASSSSSTPFTMPHLHHPHISLYPIFIFIFHSFHYASSSSSTPFTRPHLYLPLLSLRLIFIFHSFHYVIFIFHSFRYASSSSSTRFTTPHLHHPLLSLCLIFVIHTFHYTLSSSSSSTPFTTPHLHLPLLSLCLIFIFHSFHYASSSSSTPFTTPHLHLPLLSLCLIFIFHSFHYTLSSSSSSTPFYFFGCAAEGTESSVQRICREFGHTADDAALWLSRCRYCKGLSRYLTLFLCMCQSLNLSVSLSI